MPGGYIGVDIFFVISGYLISGIIYREYIKTGSFSYANFYTRRIKRIFPALIVLLVINMIVMCVYLGP
jgi:peptidoglycan/LPS O-acetylase OafA/YrhL